MIISGLDIPMVNIPKPLFAPKEKKNKLIAPSKAGAKKPVGKK